MSREADARRLLGVAEDADAATVKAARRRLAKRIHPDVEGGSDDAMRQLNDAAATLLERLGEQKQETPRPAPSRRPSRSTQRIAHDTASFVVEASPSEAFEALVVVTSWLGEGVNEDPPEPRRHGFGQLDVLLTDPLQCWCRLDLMPDAGATTVSLTIAAVPDQPLPDLDDVRDLWVSSLNDLGRRG